jgi:antagonist of KipI
MSANNTHGHGTHNHGTHEMVTILKTGLQSTLQDAGRIGARAQGVPASGAMDIFSYRVATMLANTTTNNKASTTTNTATNTTTNTTTNTAAIEFLDGGFAAQFHADCLVAFAGAELEVEFEQVLTEVLTEAPTEISTEELFEQVQDKTERSARSLARFVMSAAVFAVQAGTIVRVRRITAGVRAYCAVAGGFVADDVLGSGSTYLRGGFGGFGGRALRKGDVLHAHTGTSTGVNTGISTGISTNTGVRVCGVVSGWFAHKWLRYTSFSQFSQFSQSSSSLQSSPEAAPLLVRVLAASAVQAAAQFAHITAATFVVQSSSDRMGTRLQAIETDVLMPVLAPSATSGMLSTAVASGTIQMPPDGSLIVLQPDAGTTGGYAIVGHVIAVDMPALAQRRAGERIRFVEVSLDEAHRLLHERERDLALLRAACLLG